MKTTYLRLVLGIGVVSTVGLLFLADSSFSQEPNVKAEAKEPAKYMGISDCLRCHQGPRPGNKEDQAILEYIRLDEGVIWHDKDVHRIAYDVLTTKNGLGQQMGKLLGIEDVSKSPQCLSCHSVDLAPVAWDQLDERMYDPEQYKHENGVSCEACHGPSSKWIIGHQRLEWRTKSVQAKSAEGMIDLRDPHTRAQLCTSCHVGDWKLGRVVTHEMYAAGHPPLPPIEVATFSHDEPMHYKPARELPFITNMAKEKPEQAWHLYHFRLDESSNVRQLAVGALTTFRRNMQMVVHEAESAQNREEYRTLDWANFDCYACHHELTVPSWRQKRGFRGVPGRPQVRSWSVPLTRLIARHADGQTNGDLEQNLDEQLQQLVSACDARTFGKRKELLEAARNLVNWTDAALRTVQAVRYTDKEAKRLFTMLVEGTDKQNQWLDADGAQQLVWAVEILRREIAPNNAELLTQLQTLDSMLPLHIRDANQKLEPIANLVDTRWKRIYRFQPTTLFETFDNLGKLLGREMP